MSVPSQDEVRSIVACYTDVKVDAIRRFPAGLCHYVFDVEAGGEHFVVRISSEENVNYLHGSLYWNDRLRKVGVPLPSILFHDLDAPHPVIILERIAGTDLGEVYSDLSQVEKQALAKDVAGIQVMAATLPQANGFGYAFSYDDGALLQCPTWQRALEQDLAQTRNWIQEGGICDKFWVDRVQEAVESHRGYFDSVRPQAFLDDTTTKNVIVDQGKLSGVVDVDQVCFGDPLQVVGLTQMYFRRAT